MLCMKDGEKTKNESGGEEGRRRRRMKDVSSLYPWWPVPIVPADSDISEIFVKKK